MRVCAGVLTGARGVVAGLRRAGSADGADGAAATRYAALSTTFGVTSPLIAASWSAPVARAYAGWCLLAAVCAYAVHDAASRGRIGASTFVTLRRGLRAHATCHAALVAAAIASAQLTPPLAAPVVAGALAALGFALP